MAESHDLPRIRTSFVGRDGELEQLERLLGDVTVLTLIGPGGVGKTRSAIELGHRAAHRFPAGVRLAGPGVHLIRPDGYLAASGLRAVESHLQGVYGTTGRPGRAARLAPRRA